MTTTIRSHLSPDFFEPLTPRSLKSFCTAWLTHCAQYTPLSSKIKTPEGSTPTLPHDASPSNWNNHLMGRGGLDALFLSSYCDPSELLYATALRTPKSLSKWVQDGFYWARALGQYAPNIDPNVHTTDRRFPDGFSDSKTHTRTADEYWAFMQPQDLLEDSCALQQPQQQEALIHLARASYVGRAISAAIEIHLYSQYTQTPSSATSHTPSTTTQTFPFTLADQEGFLSSRSKTGAPVDHTDPSVGSFLRLREAFWSRILTPSEGPLGPKESLEIQLSPYRNTPELQNPDTQKSSSFSTLVYAQTFLADVYALSRKHHQKLPLMESLSDCLHFAYPHVSKAHLSQIISALQQPSASQQAQLDALRPIAQQMLIDLPTDALWYAQNRPKPSTTLGVSPWYESHSKLRLLNLMNMFPMHHRGIAQLADTIHSQYEEQLLNDTIQPSHIRTPASTDSYSTTPFDHKTRSSSTAGVPKVKKSSL